jgi:hypothetical protein
MESLGGSERASDAWRKASDCTVPTGFPCLSKKVVGTLGTGMLYDCSPGEVWTGDVCSSMICSGETATVLGVLTSPQGPNLESVRMRTTTASSGSSTFQRLARTLRMPRVRRAQSQPSAISSRCLTPWMISRFAFFSGRLRRCIVHAEWAM